MNMLYNPGIKDFYSGKTIFVTGATGFLGKALVEKLLRSCDDIHCIYILIRNKKSKSAKERANEYTSDPIFEFNGLKQSGICNKIEPIFGDTLEPNLGISEEDRRKLIRTVNVVIHLAASVKLNGTLRFSVEKNVKPIPHLIELCHQMERLDCLVYSSTIAILNGTDNASEVVQKTRVSPEFVLKACENWSDEKLAEMCKTYFHEYNNTYCISKSLAEQLLLRESKRFKIAIIRPSAILPAVSEPVQGYVQGMQIIRIALLVGLGLIRVFPYIVNQDHCVIPVDFVVRAIISSAWFVSSHKNSNIEVFNLTTKSGHSMPIKEILNEIKRYSIIYPSKRMIRYPELTFTSHRIEFEVKNVLNHWLFAVFIDYMSKLMGRKTRLCSNMKVINDSFEEFQQFFNTSPQFQLDNTFRLLSQMSKTDQKEFGFDVTNIEWNSYPKNIWLGLKRFLLKEKDNHIGSALKHLDRYYILSFNNNQECRESIKASKWVIGWGLLDFEPKKHGRL